MAAFNADKLYRFNIDNMTVETSNSVKLLGTTISNKSLKKIHV